MVAPKLLNIHLSTSLSAVSIIGKHQNGKVRDISLETELGVNATALQVSKLWDTKSCFNSHYNYVYFLNLIIIIY